MVIQPGAVQRAYFELLSNGQVPCFVVTGTDSYFDSREAYGLAHDDILQIAGMMVFPTGPEIDMDPDSSFLMFSVDSELTYGGVS